MPVSQTRHRRHDRMARPRRTISRPFRSSSPTVHEKEAGRWAGLAPENGTSGVAVAVSAAIGGRPGCPSARRHAAVAACRRR
jgi:hypothetical protein